MFVPIPKVKFQEFSKTKLVMSTNSIGNVGGNAIDLLYFNSDQKIQKIGYLQTNCLLPWVGVNDFSQEFDSISLPLEVYQTEGITFVQRRSGVKEGRLRDFLEVLREFFKVSVFQQIILLGSINEGIRHDTEITNLERTVYYHGSSAGNLNYKNENGFISVKELAKNLGEEKELEILSGAPFIYKLFQFKKFDEFPIISIFVFAARGQDLRSCLYLIKGLNKLLSNPFGEISFQIQDPVKTMNLKLPQSFQNYLNAFEQEQKQ